MSGRKRQVVKTLDGKGTVYENDKPISEVLYGIKIAQEYIISRSLSTTEEIPGLKEITGQIQVLSGEKDLGGKMLVLKLQDGSTWKFFAPRGDFLSGIYTAVNSGGEGIVPP